MTTENAVVTSAANLVITGQAPTTPMPKGFYGLWIEERALARDEGFDGDVYAIGIGDDFRIPWPKGMTFREALMAWKAA